MEVQWVADLIDAESGSWDVSILRKVFDEDSVQRVQQVVLTDCRRRDYPIWKHDPQGIFSVKSAYRVAVGADLHCEAVGSSDKTRNQRMWKHLWKLKIPNKVKFHIWRASLNALPTRFYLCRRRILQDPCCPICNSASETTTHALWACPYAVSVWALSPGRLQKLPSSEVDFFLLARQFFQDMECETRELWAVICWAIWYARNKFIHESLLLPPQQTLDMATRLLRDYQIVKSGQHLISAGMHC